MNQAMKVGFAVAVLGIGSLGTKARSQTVPAPDWKKQERIHVLAQTLARLPARSRPMPRSHYDWNPSRLILSIDQEKIAWVYDSGITIATARELEGSAFMIQTVAGEGSYLVYKPFARAALKRHPNGDATIADLKDYGAIVTDMSEIEKAQDETPLIRARIAQKAAQDAADAKAVAQATVTAAAEKKAIAQIAESLQKP